MQGDSVMLLHYVAMSARASQVFQEATARPEMVARVRVENQIHEVEGDYCQFADDSAKTAPISDVDEMNTNSEYWNAEFDNSVAMLNGAQNASKQQNLVFFQGKDARERMQQVHIDKLHNLKGTVPKALRYLGGWFSVNGCWKTDLAERLRKTKVGWISMGRLW